MLRCYQRKFGDWYKACLEFLAWKSGVSAKEIETEAEPSLVDKIREQENCALNFLVASLRSFKER